MDWSGWASYGAVATVLLTAVLVGAQLAGLTRFDIPLMLGTLLIGDPDRARFIGLFLHLGFGQFLVPRRWLMISCGPDNWRIGQHTYRSRNRF